MDEIKSNIQNHLNKRKKTAFYKKSIVNNYFKNLIKLKDKQRIIKKLKKIFLSIYFITILNHKIKKKRRFKKRRKLKNSILKNTILIRKINAKIIKSSVTFKKSRIKKRETINSPIINKLKKRYKIKKLKSEKSFVNLNFNLKRKFKNKSSSLDFKYNPNNLAFLKKGINSINIILDSKKLNYKLNKKYNLKQFKLKFNNK